MWMTKLKGDDLIVLTVLKRAGERRKEEARHLTAKLLE